MNRLFTFILALAATLASHGQDTPPAPVAPLPTPHQVAWQQMETYAFIHFGPNTFTDREWGYGDAPVSSFNPRRLDCEQWVRVLKAAGMKGVIITAKHHDGFCLWPSRYTDYSVRNSPFRDGKGDVVGELAAACEKYGLKMGVYLSPWDRHQATYATPLYVDYFHAQLEELLNNYGPLFEIWFDGANGGDGYYGGARETRHIDRRTYYDFPRAHRRIAALQPQAVVFSDGGPGCRWVGNERGEAGTTNWSFLRKDEVYPGYDRHQELTQGHPDGDAWVAAECDVSIRPGWFYHHSEDSQVKTAAQLCDLYYKSVGRNGTLLLNFPVDDEGLIHSDDSAQAVGFCQRIRRELGTDLLRRAAVSATNGRGRHFPTSALTDGDFDTYWAMKDGATTGTLTFTLRRPQLVNRLSLQEYIPLGQRVRAFLIEYKGDNGEWQPLPLDEPTTTIGYKRLLRFDAVRAKALRVTITDARGPVCLSAVGAFYAPDEAEATAVVAPAASRRSTTPLYLSATATTDERVADLLKRMTTAEKVGQLRCTMGWDYYSIAADGHIEPSESFKRDYADGRIGMLWATFRADPWTCKTLSNGLTPERAAEAANVLQRYAIEHSPHGIPLLLAEEAPHGHMAIGTTVYPTGLGMAATWSPLLLERVGEAIGREVRCQGGHISYGPVLDLVRDPRWSRSEETLGEDPVLASALGAAMVKGLSRHILSTLKHFVAYGTSDGGQNGGASSIGPRALHQFFLPPFKAAVEAGAAGIMTAYNSIDGIPCTAHDELLRGVLRGQWGFRGLVVSDLYAIDGLAGTHRVVADRRQAAVASLKAGVDVDLGGAAYARLTAAVEDGQVDEALIDSAVARVLRQKIELGLFEHPYVDPKGTDAVHSKAHQDIALQTARAAVTLLKNDTVAMRADLLAGVMSAASTGLAATDADSGEAAAATLGGSGRRGLLPLGRDVRLLVCGPNADNAYNQLGDYTAPQRDEDVVTILEGLRAKLPSQQVTYVKGCGVRDTTDVHIAEAVAAAADVDVIVACVGGSSARDFRTDYEATGAASSVAGVTADEPRLADMDCGEGFDRASLSLLGRQQALLEALAATGKPLVVVYIEGRPLDKTWAARHAAALLTAYYPGQMGGLAVADVLLGDYNPAGRLPLSHPRDVGQLPVYYNQLSPRSHDYVEMASAPLYPFGYGLSYTHFEYDDLVIEAVDGDRPSAGYRVSLDVTNSGDCDGEEVVQLYLRDDVASVVTSVQQLKSFARVAIPRGQTRHVAFNLRASDFTLIDRQLRPRVEAGRFTVLVGSSSSDIRLRGSIDVTP